MAKLKKTIEERVAKATLTPEEVKGEDAKKSPTGYLYPDAQALQLTLDDLTRCDAFMNINVWASNWILADTLLQSPQNNNQLVGQTRTNIPVFTLSNHLSAIVPKIMESLFYEDPPFLLRPRPGTTQDVIRAKTAVFTAQLDDMDFQEQCGLLVEQMALLGTCIAKWGWCEYTKKVRVYKSEEDPQKISTEVGFKSTVHTEKSDNIQWEYEDEKVCRPWLKFVDIRTIRVDPGCRVGNIQRAKYVIETQYPTYLDLEELRGQEDYCIPSEEVLRAFFEREEGAKQGGDNLAMTMPEGMRGWIQHATPRNQRSTADPLETPLLLIERQDCHSIITVLCHGTDNILIRNSENPAEKPSYLSANWRNIPDCFYGQGLGILVGMEQITKQGLKNLATDLISYGLHPQAVRKKGFNAPTQSIIWRQGGIIDVDDDVDKAFKFLEMPSPPAAAWQLVQITDSSAEESSGANQQTTMGAGSPGTKTTGMRSGTGAQLVGQANASRLDGPVSRFINQIFVPFLYEMDQMNNQYLPTSVLRKILDDEGLENLKELDHNAWRNAKLKYEVLAGAHLGPRKEMTQFMPFLIQIVNNPTLMDSAGEDGKVFSFKHFFKSMADLAGWKYSQDFFTDMTPEQKQKHAAKQPAAMQQAQAQAQGQMQDKKFQQEQEMQNQKDLGRAANEVLRLSTEKALEGEISGGPDQTSGLGSLVT
jgi:hypothetical protein